jgi:hypothetical protein
MEHGTMLFTIISGAIGQWVKAHQSIPTWIPNAVMTALGLAWYAGNHGMPAWTFAAVTDWIETALLAAAAIPGTATLIGAFIPALKTDSKPKTT